MPHTANEDELTGHLGNQRRVDENWCFKGIWIVQAFSGWAFKMTLICPWWQWTSMYFAVATWYGLSLSCFWSLQKCTHTHTLAFIRLQILPFCECCSVTKVLISCFSFYNANNIYVYMTFILNSKLSQHTLDFYGFT